MKRLVIVCALALVMLIPVGAITQKSADAHTGWHYSYWCDSGWYLYYGWYAYANPWGGHGSVIARDYGNLGRCWF